MEIVVLSGQIEFGVGQMGTEKEQAFEKIHKDSRVKLMKYTYLHIDCFLFLFLKYGIYLLLYVPFHSLLKNHLKSTTNNFLFR